MCQLSQEYSGWPKTRLLIVDDAYPTFTGTGTGPLLLGPPAAQPNVLGCDPPWASRSATEQDQSSPLPPNLWKGSSTAVQGASAASRLEVTYELRLRSEPWYVGFQQYARGTVRVVVGWFNLSLVYQWSTGWPNRP